MSIIISGGGMTGAVLAVILSQCTEGALKISLIEQYPINFDNIETKKLYIKNFIPNVIALSRGAYFELSRLNMIDILSSCSTAIKRIKVSEYGKLNTVLVDAKNYKLPELGYTIESNKFRENLFSFLLDQPNVFIYCPEVIEKITHDRNSNTVYLKSNRKISAKLVVAADGTDSIVAASCGIKWFQRDYQQCAVVSVITTEFPHFNKAFERFTEFGPLALLPMLNNYSFLIWCFSNKKKEEMIKWSRIKFSQELQKIFGWELGKILDIGKWHCYDLKLKYANSHIAHRLALVGNAAQTLHPVAGQGFNLGLRDVIVLSKVIMRALYKDVDFGDYDTLNMYQKKRSVDQQRTVKITDNLIRLFNSNYYPLILIRNLGLLLINYNLCAQRFLINTILDWRVD